MSEKDKERIMRHVRANTEGCWLWTGCVRSKDKPYGRLIVGSRKDGTRRSLGAHQFSYMTFVGPIPTKMCVCHKCDNPRCVNPDHLFLGSKRDNALDMVCKGRSTGKLSHSLVAEIRASTLGSKKLAATYGVDDSHIRAIRRGKYYSPPPPTEKE